MVNVIRIMRGGCFVLFLLFFLNQESAENPVGLDVFFYSRFLNTFNLWYLVLLKNSFLLKFPVLLGNHFFLSSLPTPYTYMLKARDIGLLIPYIYLIISWSFSQESFLHWFFTSLHILFWCKSYADLQITAEISL